MAEPIDPFADARAVAQQSWDAWMRAFAPAPAPAAMPFAPFFGGAAPAPDAFLRGTQGVKGFMDWMGAAMAQAAQPAVQDWTQSLRQLFGGDVQPFLKAFEGIDQVGAHGFVQAWQPWMQLAQQNPLAGIASMTGWHGAPMAPLGYTREQQLAQQAIAAAMRTYTETLSRYQQLLQQANTQGMERLQQVLAQRGEANTPVESMKALYDLWVDACEEAYAEIAASEEFSEAYGAMVNAQMHVRHLLQQEIEAFCRQLGMPTRSEIASMGERLQSLRRELARMRAGASNDVSSATARTPPTAPARKTAPRKVAKAATKKVASKKSTAGKVASKSRPATTAARKRSGR